VRILLIPLTVKQVKSTRVMQELAPEIKKLQAKYKNDKTKLNEEMMALYKERGFNPMAGCWPLLAQMPFFFALYQVIYRPVISGEPNILYGRTFFGVPLQQHWLVLPGWDKIFSQAGITILILTTAMALTTYISQRQLMNKQTAQVNPQQQTIMKMMPLMFFVFAVNVPLAVIIYWVTTNFWSVGQQYILLRTHPMQPVTDAQAAPAGAAALTDNNGEGRKGLGPLRMFRGLTSRPAESSPPPTTSKNGKQAAKADDGRPAPKKGGPAAKSAQARPGPNNGRGTSGNRRTGSRSSGKGKSSGPRRGKR
jgi:YidC/Oxa1 family membrane protein insertase